MSHLTEILEDFKNSDRREDRLAYISFLKEIGVLGKRIYVLKQEEWLKNHLINLYKYIQKYVKNNL